MMRFLATLSMIILSACAAPSVQALRSAPTERMAASVEGNYQRVYRDLLTRARECFQTGLYARAMLVQGEIFSDIHSGSITIGLQGPLGADIYYAIDLKAAGDSRTDAILYSGLPVGAPRFRVIADWLTKDSKACD